MNTTANNALQILDVASPRRSATPWSMARGLAAALLLALCAPAWAATYTVNSTADTDDTICDAGDCTLREAINAANANPGSDTIDFNLIGCSCTITLTSPIPMDQTQNLTINGPGAGNLTIVGALEGGTNKFDTTTLRGNLVVRGLTFTGNSNTAVISYAGKDGSVVIEDSVFVGGLSFGSSLFFHPLVAVRNTVFRGTFRTTPLFVDGRTGTNQPIEVSNCTFNTDHVFSQSAPFGNVIKIYNTNAATITNSTFFDNDDPNFSTTVLFDSGALTVSNSTFSNSKNTQSGGGEIVNGGTVTLRNNIFTKSAGGRLCDLNFGIGTFIDGGGNVFSDDGSACGYSDPSSRINANAGLDPGGLQDNGGPVPTLALLASSDAIDAGVDSICAAAPVNNLDQRGVARPSGAHCDSGAFERDVTPNPFSFAPKIDAPLNSSQTSSTTVTVSGLDNGVSVPVSVSGDPGFAYSKNGGLFTSVSGTVSNGDTLQIQVNASGAYASTTRATLNVGGVNGTSGTFWVTTLNSPPPPPSSCDRNAPGVNVIDMSGSPYARTIVGRKNQKNVIIGSRYSDTITAGDLGDCIQGNGGNDRITGGAGDDLLIGGSGNDTISGNGGKDTLVGNGGNDWLDGGNGDDLLLGGSGNDHFNGGAGNNICAGNGGLDTFTNCQQRR